MLRHTISVDLPRGWQEAPSDGAGRVYRPKHRDGGTVRFSLMPPHAGVDTESEPARLQAFESWLAGMDMDFGETVGDLPVISAFGRGALRVFKHPQRGLSAVAMVFRPDITAVATWDMGHPRRAPKELEHFREILKRLRLTTVEGG